MNGLENFHRLMERRGAQWLPLDVPCTAPVRDLLEKKTGQREPMEAFNLDMSGVRPKDMGDPRAWQKVLESMGFEAPPKTEYDGMGWATAPAPEGDVGEAYHFRLELHPLAAVTSVEQLQALPWPRVDDPAYFADLEQEVRQLHARGKFTVGGLYCTMFEASWYRRGMDNLYIDLIEGNGISDWLLDYFTQRACAVARAYVHTGVDVIGLGDDIGTQRGMMVSPDFWRQHLKPRFAQVIGTIRRESEKVGRQVYIFYHTDGDVRDVLGELFDLGIDILNPMQPECMPVREVVQAHHDKAFWGAIGTQTTMPFGKPEDVRRAAEELVELGRQGARFIIAPTHVLEPEVPWENIQALVQVDRRL